MNENSFTLFFAFDVFLSVTLWTSAFVPSGTK